MGFWRRCEICFRLAPLHIIAFHMPSFVILSGFSLDAGCLSLLVFCFLGFRVKLSVELID
jgi:hypothetical protein